jgi:hypothetical protein
VHTSSIRELADMLQDNKRAAAAAAPPPARRTVAGNASSGGAAPDPRPRLGYGLVVPWQAVDKLLQGTRRPQSPHDHEHLPPLKVVVLLRDPFFWVLSQAKKLALREDAAASARGTGVKCANIHQRGTALCPITRWAGGSLFSARPLQHSSRPEN